MGQTYDELVKTKADHAALCKAVEDWAELVESFKPVVGTAPSPDLIIKVREARDHMLKLAKDGLDGTK